MTDIPKVQFYYDFISPYAYFGWVGLRELAAETPGLVLEPVPVLFAGLLNHWGQKGPAEISAKRAFTYQDAIRKGTRAGLPMRFPPAHPFNPLHSLRLMVALEDNPARDDAITRVFEACWTKEQDITQPAVLEGILEGLGLDDPAATLARCQDPAVKAQLRENTESAIAAGVFGVPTFLVDGTLLWGSDQLDFVKLCLEDKDPAKAYGLEALANLPAAASRI